MTLDARRRRDRRRVRWARVYLDGRDVTHGCYYADGRRGVVRLMLRDLAGHIVCHPTRPTVVRYERRGHVRIVVRKARVIHEVA